MMGFALVGSTAGSVVGPSLGGALYELGGYGLPFAAVACLLALDLGMRVFLLPRDWPRARAGPDLRALLLDRAILAPALAVGLAAFGWGTVEPLLPAHIERGGGSAAAIGLLFTISTVVYGLCAPLVAVASRRLPIRRVIVGGVVGMSAMLVALSQLNGVVATGIGLSLLSAAFAFTLNPTSAELGNAVERRGLSCYASVYAVYNIAYSVGMMATNALATLAATRLSLSQILFSAGAALLVCIPLLLLKDQPARPVSA